jgi:hypothetical protein
MIMAQRIIDRSYVGEVLQRMYVSDLDISICFGSTGGYFYVDAQNKRITLHGTTIEEAISDLASRVAKELPASSFATWWVNNFRQEMQ